MKTYPNCNFLDPKAFRFSQYNDLVLNILGEQAVSDQKLVFIFIDAFGWCFFDRFKGSIELLRRFQIEGSAENGYSQFPSTTACHLTTLHFGLPVAESGIFEWFYHEPTADGIIAPLLFSRAGDEDRETLLKAGITPEQIFPFASFYQKLSAIEVPSFIFQSENYCPSSFSEQAFKGAKVTTYASERQGLEFLANAVNTHQGKGYFFLYLDSIDVTSHKYGPNSPQVNQAIENIFSMIQDCFVNTVQKKSAIKLMIGADHGQIDVNPTKTYYLDKELPECHSWFRCNSKGEPLVPGGSMRDMFLYLKPEYKSRALEVLTNSIGHIADVCDTNHLLEQGYFGPAQTISKRLTDRLSEVVIVPFAGESVWWSGNGKFEKDFLGSHGGLSPAEIQIPRLILDL